MLDIEGLLGLGPAIVLAAGALAALPAGLLMDRMGRVPILAAGFGCGIAGCLLAALGSAQGWAVAVLAGLVLVGTASATGLLARTAAGDMYPPERRARGIALVLFGSVFGAILGPAVFSPLLAGRDLDGDALAHAVGRRERVHGRRPGDRPDRAARSEADRRAARTRAGRSETEPPQAPTIASPAATPIRELLRRPGVIPALVAAQASFAVMVAVMTLTGAVIVDHNHHSADNVFPIIGAHVIGMFGLIIVVGDIVDSVGRTRALAGGLMLMAASTISLLWITGVPASMVALFGLGLGWNFSFVAATAVLSDMTEPSERGKLLGFNDLLAGLTGAGLALLGGLALTALGVASLAIGGAALVAAPALWILRHGRLHPPRSEPPCDDTIRRNSDDPDI